MYQIRRLFLFISIYSPRYLIVGQVINTGTSVGTIVLVCGLRRGFFLRVKIIASHLLEFYLIFHLFSQGIEISKMDLVQSSWLSNRQLPDPIGGI